MHIDHAPDVLRPPFTFQKKLPSDCALPAHPPSQGKNHKLLCYISQTDNNFYSMTHLSFLPHNNKTHAFFSEIQQKSFESVCCSSKFRDSTNTYPLPHP